MGPSLGSMLRTRRWVVERNARNLLKHGRHAPRLFQVVWFDPSTCERYSEDFVHIRFAARVIGGDWPARTRALSENPVLNDCRRHWVEGVPWARTGVYERLARRIDEAGGPVDGCASMQDIVRRYAALDRMFEQVARERRLRTPQELHGRRPGNPGAVRIHFDERGEPVFALSGHHRLGMALTLGLPWMPAQVQVVYPTGLRLWGASVRTREPAEVARP